MFIINNLLSLLEEKGLKQADLCEAIGISSSTMTNWKNRGTDPPAKYIVPICEFLDISPYLLLTGKEKSSPTVELEQNEVEMIEIFREFDGREQVKIIGRMEEWLEVKQKREAISQSQKIVGVQVARRTDGKFVKEPVTAEEMKKIKALPEDTDF